MYIRLNNAFHALHSPLVLSPPIQYPTFYRILKEAERREKLEIAKREKEVKHQLFMEEKKRKQEEKQEEKMKKLQEIEMKRQQNAIMKEQVTIFRFLLSVGNIY